MVDKIGDPFLNYFALGLLVFVAIAIFYGIIAIHDIPTRIAKAGHHPHEDAIHAAGWVSLFTLHVLWPFLWIWAMAYQPERGWGFSVTGAEPPAADEIRDLQRRLDEIEARLKLKAEKAQNRNHRNQNGVQKLKVRTGDND